MASRGDIVFYRGNSLADDVIAGWEQVAERMAQTIGKRTYWTHVAIAKGGGSAICAWAGGGGMKSGVIANYMDRYQNPKPGQVTRVLTPLPKRGVDLYADALSFVGRPYDFVGLASDPLWDLFRYRMNCGGPPESFTCSSLVGFLLMRYGHLWAPKPVRALTPDDIFEAVSAA